KPLSAEASELLKLELANMGADWLDAFLPEMQKPYFLQIKRNLEKERLTNQVFPAAEEIYSFTKYPLADIKVVILGQDPYHDVGQAHGLCFSVKKGVKVPPSLVNIYKEIKDEYPDFGIPQHGFLEGWSKQGVLLLNATLTVRAHNANSHSKWGWSTFTDAIISHISRNSRAGVVFILWGGNARKKVSLIDKKKHCVLESAHPSPLSAHNGFFGCGHFKKANEYLERTGREAIEWGRLE
ncbi:uracil-DNA glycosylase-like protein, partial [Zopfochytrium polystomum]